MAKEALKGNKLNERKKYALKKFISEVNKDIIEDSSKEKIAI